MQVIDRRPVSGSSLDHPFIIHKLPFKVISDNVAASTSLNFDDQWERATKLLVRPLSKLSTLHQYNTMSKQALHTPSCALCTGPVMLSIICQWLFRLFFVDLFHQTISCVKIGICKDTRHACLASSTKTFC